MRRREREGDDRDHQPLRRSSVTIKQYICMTYLLFLLCNIYRTLPRVQVSLSESKKPLLVKRSAFPLLDVPM
jgi:hypothetical protein